MALKVKMNVIILGFPVKTAFDIRDLALFANTAFLLSWWIIISKQ